MVASNKQKTVLWIFTPNESVVFGGMYFNENDGKMYVKKISTTKFYMNLTTYKKRDSFFLRSQQSSSHCFLLMFYFGGTKKDEIKDKI